MKKDFLSISDIDEYELASLVTDALRLKRLKSEGTAHEYLKGKSLGMIFEKASTRTRVSFEVGMSDLGGHALFLNPQDMQLGRGEEVKDTARVLARYVDAVMIRAYEHATIEEFARYATVPVINGLSDTLHPCQVLADIMTITERFSDLRDLRLAWIGDGNNVCNTWILSAAMTGMGSWSQAHPATSRRIPSSTRRGRQGAESGSSLTRRRRSAMQICSTLISGSRWAMSRSVLNACGISKITP